MNRLSMIALVAGLTGLASAAMAQQQTNQNQPPPPPGPYQAATVGSWLWPGSRLWPAARAAGQAQAEAPKTEAKGEAQVRRTWARLRRLRLRPPRMAMATGLRLWLRRSVRLRLSAPAPAGGYG